MSDEPAASPIDRVALVAGFAVALFVVIAVGTYDDESPGGVAAGTAWMQPVAFVALGLGFVGLLWSGARGPLGRAVRSQAAAAVVLGVVGVALVAVLRDDARGSDLQTVAGFVFVYAAIGAGAQITASSLWRGVRWLRRVAARRPSASPSRGPG